MKPLLLYLLHTPANCTLACLAVTCCSLQFLEKGSIKEKKDPTKPKGVLSAYNFWPGRCQKEHGEVWATLDAAGKSLYVHMHEEDKKRFAMEMEAYHNAFLIFVKHNRERIMEKNACLRLLQISNKCGEEWEALDATDKKGYGYEEGNKTI
jgi:hypothetical protein